MLHPWSYLSFALFPHFLDLFVQSGGCFLGKRKEGGWLFYMTIVINSPALWRENPTHPLLELCHHVCHQPVLAVQSVPLAELKICAEVSSAAALQSPLLLTQHDGLLLPTHTTISSLHHPYMCTDGNTMGLSFVIHHSHAVILAWCTMVNVQQSAYYGNTTQHVQNMVVPCTNK